MYTYNIHTYTSYLYRLRKRNEAKHDMYTYTNITSKSLFQKKICHCQEHPSTYYLGQIMVFNGDYTHLFCIYSEPPSLRSYCLELHAWPRPLRSAPHAPAKKYAVFCFRIGMVRVEKAERGGFPRQAWDLAGIKSQIPRVQASPQTFASGKATRGFPNFIHGGVVHNSAWGPT